ncbi:hypothetical protein ACA910_013307 [Epithemia clementina (nom. ined.)]
MTTVLLLIKHAALLFMVVNFLLKSSNGLPIPLDRPHNYRHVGGSSSHAITFLKSTTATTDDNGSSTTNSPSSSFRLKDCICLVTGASRGIGKGIALELGAEGATVYVTGTSTSSSSAGNKNNNVDPGTVEETAQEINDLGGKGVAVLCNHEVDDDVARLMEQINREHGRLDILVNNAFRLPPGGVEKLFGKFWEQGLQVWDTLHNVGLRSHFVATCYAMPLLLKARDEADRRQHLPRPFIGMISSFGGITYSFNVPYGVQKAAVDRLAKDMAIELTPENITVVSFWPGIVDTERTKVSVANGEWDKYVGLPLDNAESTRFTGTSGCASGLGSQQLGDQIGNLSSRGRIGARVWLYGCGWYRSTKYSIPSILDTNLWLGRANETSNCHHNSYPTGSYPFGSWHKAANLHPDHNDGPKPSYSPG